MCGGKKPVASVTIRISMNLWLKSNLKDAILIPKSQPRERLRSRYRPLQPLSKRHRARAIQAAVLSSGQIGNYDSYRRRTTPRPFGAYQKGYHCSPTDGAISLAW